jgi:hypothetical protein
MRLPSSVLRFLDAYPGWLVAACEIIVCAAVVWIVLKLLKWGLWLALVAVLAVGAILLFRELIR